MYNFNLLNRINEARVERTIDSKLWASVSSAISKTYKSDFGASAKPIGTRDQLLQRFVAGLIILKQQCPITEKDMKDCPAFNQWANKLIQMGVTMPEIHKLWNENCGKLPKVDTTINSVNNIDNDSDILPDINNEDDDDIMTGVSIDDDEEDINDEEIINNQTSSFVQQPKFQHSGDISTASYNKDPYILIDSLHKILFGKNSQFPNLHGCKDPEDAIKYLNQFNPRSEGINDSGNLDDLLSNKGNVYALRVFKGGNPEEVTGDCVWCNASTPTSYYINVTPTKVSIYYKEANGDFSLAWDGNHADFGFIS